MATRKEYEPEPDTLDTVRGLKKLSSVPWQEQVNRAFEGLTKDFAEMKTNIAVIKERMLAQPKSQEIAKEKEKLAVLATEFRTLKHVVYWVGAAIGLPLIGLGITRLFGK